MRHFSPREILTNYQDQALVRMARPVSQTFILAIMAGMVIALTAAGTSIIAAGFNNIYLQRLIIGLTFPFGLAIIIIIGAELFTGNCMLIIPVMEKRISIFSMAMNLNVVYFGNIIGCISVVIGWSLIQPTTVSESPLGEFLVQLSSAKLALPMSRAFISGVLCNILVCLGIICALSARDTTGVLVGAFLPVSLFVFCGYEHIVANMFYLPIGSIISTETVDIPAISAHVIAVTLGNVVGGFTIGSLFWFGTKNKQ